ncbi:MAG: hypothetical protein AAGA76_06650 [Pseudomonadota bacterium]
MKKYILTALILLAGTQIAVADSCSEKFIRLMTDRAAKEPTKILITQEIKGGAKTVNWNYQDGEGNWLTEMVEPANAQWSMGLNNILYSSADKGKTWSKIRDMGEQNDAHQKSLEERSATVENAICGTAELDGVMYETVEADYKMLGSFNADIHDKFWVNPETGYVKRLETAMKNTAFESFVVQVLEPAPDLVFPTPE